MDQASALRRIRDFFKSKTSYDVMPVSSKLVMLDVTLSARAALLTMLQNGIISCAIWDSVKYKFVGLLTAADFIDAVHYQIVSNDWSSSQTLVLTDLAEIKTKINARPVATTSINPYKSVYDACKVLLDSSAHRVPLIDQDDKLGFDVVVSVLTQYRVLRFMALNCKETRALNTPIGELNLVTTDVRTAHMDNTVQDAIATFHETGVSTIPIVDDNGCLLNMYETYDVLTLLRSSSFQNDRHLTIGEALMRRPSDFEGLMTCAESDSLADIMEIVRRNRVLRLCVVDEKQTLKGIVTLSDILDYIING